MDVRMYYRKICETEAMINAPLAVVVSKNTPDGGKAGVVNEVPSSIAAQLLVEGRARLATQDETKKYRDGFAAAAAPAKSSRS